MEIVKNKEKREVFIPSASLLTLMFIGIIINFRTVYNYYIYTMGKDTVY